MQSHLWPVASLPTTKKQRYHRGYFYGFTRHTVFTILLQAVAGLTVSRILKYADAVQKNVAASLRGPILATWWDTFCFLILSIALPKVGRR